jgi:hypothetical protein
MAPANKKHQQSLDCLGRYLYTYTALEFFFHNQIQHSVKLFEYDNIKYFMVKVFSTVLQQKLEKEMTYCYLYY